MSRYGRQVFLNVPFDNQYKKLLRALVFAVHRCGLVARTAQEKDDSGQVRLDKIFEIVRDCQFGIHDLSRTTLDAGSRLPRFNMPLELGIFLGATRFGNDRDRKKACLILDRDQYRFQVFCSDIAGQDIRAHSNEVSHALKAVRNWLQTHLPASAALPGPSSIMNDYLEFQHRLPGMCRDAQLRQSDMTFLDYRQLVSVWCEY
jgi:hypothetical protein